MAPTFPLHVNSMYNPLLLMECSTSEDDEISLQKGKGILQMYRVPNSVDTELIKREITLGRPGTLQMRVWKKEARINNRLYLPC